MKKFLLAMVAVPALSVGAQAASIVNSDSEPRVVVVTDGGNQQELSLAAGERAEFCPKGCFISLEGERQTLLGSESVEIKGGRMLVR